MRGRYWGNFSPQALLRVASVKVSRNRVLKKICDIPMCSRSRNSFKGSFIFVSSRNKGVIENKPKAVEKKKIAKSGKPRRRVPEQWPLYGLSISGSEASLKIVWNCDLGPLFARSPKENGNSNSKSNLSKCPRHDRSQGPRQRPIASSSETWYPSHYSFVAWQVSLIIKSTYLQESTSKKGEKIPTSWNVAFQISGQLPLLGTQTLCRALKWKAIVSLLLRLGLATVFARVHCVWFRLGSLHWWELANPCGVPQRHPLLTFSGYSKFRPRYWMSFK